MESIIAKHEEYVYAIKAYVTSWYKLNTELLNHIIADEASVVDPELEESEGKDDFIAIHDIWFKPLAESTIPAVVTKPKFLRKIVGSSLLSSEVKIITSRSELIFNLEVTHDTNIIYGVEIKEQNFVEIIRKYEPKTSE